MQKNDMITLTIHSYQQDGFGVGRSEEGRVVFVPNAAVGETWEVRIVKVMRKLAYGKAERLITPLPRANRERLPFLSRLRRLRLSAYLV